VVPSARIEVKMEEAVVKRAQAKSRHWEYQGTDFQVSQTRVYSWPVPLSPREEIS